MADLRWILVAVLVVYCDGDTKTPKQNEYFTALVHMGPLIKMENMLSGYFLDFVKKEEEKLDKLEKIIQDIEQVHPKPGSSEKVIEQHYSNPINGLKMMQRFTDVWPNVTVLFSGENTTLGEHNSHCFQSFLTSI